MSHSTRFTIEAVEYVVIHDGDWGGDARIVEFEPKSRTAHPAEPEKVKREVVLPGMLLQAIGRQATLQGIIHIVEHLMDVPADRDLMTALRRERR